MNPRATRDAARRPWWRVRNTFADTRKGCHSRAGLAPAWRLVDGARGPGDAPPSRRLLKLSVDSKP
jgi:hypothetical protein